MRSYKKIKALNFVAEINIDLEILIIFNINFKSVLSKVRIDRLITALLCKKP